MSTIQAYFRKFVIRNQLANKRVTYPTEGSKNAVKPVSPLIKAKMNETTAAAISILTSKSSNCFKTNFQKGVPACARYLRVSSL